MPHFKFNCFSFRFNPSIGLKISSIGEIVIKVSVTEALVKGGGAGGAIAPPLFGRIELAAGDASTPHYYLYYYLPPHFKKLPTPLCKHSMNDPRFTSHCTNFK
jgi:hypothetical protein